MDANQLPNPPQLAPITGGIPQPQAPHTFFLTDTLYLYSRDAKEFLSNKNRGDMSKYVNINCIKSINKICELAQELELFSTPIQIIEVEEVANKFNDDNKYLFNNVFSYFISSFANVGFNLFEPDMFNTIINGFTLYELNGINELFLTPKQLFERLQAIGLPKIVKLTFNYVMFLFSLSLTINHKFNWHDNSKTTANLYRHNAMIISFLSIFISYFKPLLDYLQLNPVLLISQESEIDIYPNIIKFINEVIILHNVGSSDELLNENSTYYNNLVKNESDSKQLKAELNLDTTNPELSYEILKEYNIQIFQEPNIDYKTLYDSSLQGEEVLPGELLKTPTNKNNEIIIPMLPEAAKTQPVLSKKLGLSQPEINSLLMDLVPNMCSSELQTKSIGNQFTIGGITINQQYPTLKTYLGYLGLGTGDTTTEILDNNRDFDIQEYFKHLMTSYSKAITNFNILTAINTHNEFIYLTEVGSFDCHIPKETIIKNVIKCTNEFAVLIGTHVQGKTSKVELQRAHRSMIIIDLRAIKANDEPSPKGKVYYFEPFGQFYPVYDILGRIIPHMPEMVIAKRFKEALPNPSTKEFNIVLPLYDDSGQIQACKTSVFQLVNTNYLGASKAFMGDEINKVINSVSLGDKHKTLDWTTGYCSLVVLFMTVLVRMNCMMGAKGDIDDILLWFNNFNQNPLYTYNNLLSRFLVRGFAQLVEKILAGEVKIIEPVKLNLQKIIGQFYSENMPQFTGHDMKKQQADNKYTKDAYDQMYKLLGLVPQENISESGVAIQQKVQTRLNTVVVYLFNLIQNYDRISNTGVAVVDENDNLITIDEKLIKKLEKHRQVIKQKPHKQYASMEVGRLFKLSISNKFRKVFGKGEKIKFLDEPSLSIFNSTTGAFNSEFPRIIFVDPEYRQSGSSTIQPINLQERLDALRIS